MVKNSTRRRIALTRLDLSTELLEYMVIGGCFFGGGGGGSIETGRAMGRQAMSIGRPHMVDLEDLPDDTLLLTVSAVGAPAGVGAHAGPDEYVRSIQLFEQLTGKKVGGFIANECGALATVNGWVQSAATGLPVVDAPANGRAHPTGAMGSMGLNSIEGYISQQVAVGGREPDGSRLEVFVQGTVESAAGLVRKAASQVGGLIAVARNPVPVSYAKVNAAPGAIRRSIEVGQAIVEGRKRSANDAINGAAAAARGSVAYRGRIVHREIESVGGFDLGKLVIEDRDTPNTEVELYFCNEYLTIEKAGSGERLCTFPDLVMIMDLHTGMPVTSAESRADMDVAVIVVPRANMILGRGMREKALFRDVERITGKELVKYVF
jgi:DUF917 family protein